MRQNLPRENLDILLDVTRLRVWEAHDDFEKRSTIGLGFGDVGKWYPR